jgi:hypothetical protein
VGSTSKACSDHLIVVTLAQVDLAMVLEDLVAQLLEKGRLLRRKLTLLVPVRQLDTDENAGHDDGEVDACREPVLVPQVLGQTSRNHRMDSPHGASADCTLPAIDSRPFWRLLTVLPRLTLWGFPAPLARGSGVSLQP